MGASIGPLLAVAFLYFYPAHYRTLFLLSFVASFFAILVLVRFVKEVAVEREVPKKSEFKFVFLGLSFFIFLLSATLFSLGRTSDAFLLLRAETAASASHFCRLFSVFRNSFLSSCKRLLPLRRGKGDFFRNWPKVFFLSL